MSGTKCLKCTYDDADYYAQILREETGSEAFGEDCFQQAYKTSSCSGQKYSFGIKNTRLYPGRTYYVKVQFRTRGDGSSTASKCSSIGFIAYWDNWASNRSYIHGPEKAYSERGKVVSWTYSFTVTSEVQPSGTGIYYIISNSWAAGSDGQTIDLYYVKYWDSLGNVYDERGTYTAAIRLNNAYVLPLRDSGKIKAALPDGTTGYISAFPRRIGTVFIQLYVSYWREEDEYGYVSYGISSIGFRAYDSSPAGRSVSVTISSMGRCSSPNTRNYANLPAQTQTISGLTSSWKSAGFKVGNISHSDGSNSSFLHWLILPSFSVTAGGKTVSCGKYQAAVEGDVDSKTTYYIE